MAAHSLWSGAINFGLVTIPIRLFTAVKTNDLSFNLLHKKDEGRIKYERVCSVDGKPVPWDEIVKGYEYEKGQYVILTDEDFERVNPKATQSVEILEFVDLDAINPMFFDKPYYIEPSKQGKHAYALLREALAKANKVAVARIVVRTKEYLATVRALEDALVLELLHWADDMVAIDTLELPDRTNLPEGEMKMAEMLIDSMTVEAFDPKKFTNRYHDEVLEMIEARAAGKELPEPEKAPARTGRVINLMDVLAQSLEQSKKQRADSKAEREQSTTKRRKKSAA